MNLPQPPDILARYIVGRLAHAPKALGPLPEAPDVVARYVVGPAAGGTLTEAIPVTEQNFESKSAAASAAVTGLSVGAGLPDQARVAVRGTDSALACAIGLVVTYRINGRVETKMLVDDRITNNSQLSTAGSGIGRYFLGKKVGDSFTVSFFGYMFAIEILAVRRPGTPSAVGSRPALSSHVHGQGPRAGKFKGLYVASRFGYKYHTPDCEWAKLIARYNLVTFSDAGAARAAGKLPCGACHPGS